MNTIYWASCARAHTRSSIAIHPHTNRVVSTKPIQDMRAIHTQRVRDGIKLTTHTQHENMNISKIHFWKDILAIASNSFTFFRFIGCISVSLSLFRSFSLSPSLSIWARYKSLFDLDHFHRELVSYSYFMHFVHLSLFLPYRLDLNLIHSIFNALKTNPSSTLPFTDPYGSKMKWSVFLDTRKKKLKRKSYETSHVRKNTATTNLFVNMTHMLSAAHEPNQKIPENYKTTTTTNRTNKGNEHQQNNKIVSLLVIVTCQNNQAERRTQ